MLRVDEGQLGLWLSHTLSLYALLHPTSLSIHQLDASGYLPHGSLVQSSGQDKHPNRPRSPLEVKKTKTVGVKWDRKELLKPWGFYFRFPS